MLSHKYQDDFDSVLCLQHNAERLFRTPLTLITFQYLRYRLYIKRPATLEICLAEAENAMNEAYKIDLIESITIRNKDANIKIDASTLRNRLFEIFSTSLETKEIAEKISTYLASYITNETVSFTTYALQMLLEKHNRTKDVFFDAGSIGNIIPNIGNTFSRDESLFYRKYATAFFIYSSNTPPDKELEKHYTTTKDALERLMQQAPTIPFLQPSEELEKIYHEYADDLRACLAHYKNNLLKDVIQTKVLQLKENIHAKFLHHQQAIDALRQQTENYPNHQLQKCKRFPPELKAAGRKLLLLKKLKESRENLKKQYEKLSLDLYDEEKLGQTNYALRLNNFIATERKSIVDLNLLLKKDAKQVMQELAILQHHFSTKEKIFAGVYDKIKHRKKIVAELKETIDYHENKFVTAARTLLENDVEHFYRAHAELAEAIKLMQTDKDNIADPFLKNKFAEKKHALAEIKISTRDFAHKLLNPINIQFNKISREIDREAYHASTEWSAAANSVRPTPSPDEIAEILAQTFKEKVDHYSQRIIDLEDSHIKDLTREAEQKIREAWGKNIIPELRSDLHQIKSNLQSINMRAFAKKAENDLEAIEIFLNQRKIEKALDEKKKIERDKENAEKKLASAKVALNHILAGKSRSPFASRQADALKQGAQIKKANERASHIQGRIENLRQFAYRKPDTHPILTIFSIITILPAWIMGGIKIAQEVIAYTQSTALGILAGIFCSLIPPLCFYTFYRGASYIYQPIDLDEAESPPLIPPSPRPAPPVVARRISLPSPTRSSRFSAELMDIANKRCIWDASIHYAFYAQGKTVFLQQKEDANKEIKFGDHASALLLRIIALLQRPEDLQVKRDIQGFITLTMNQRHHYFILPTVNDNNNLLFSYESQHSKSMRPLLPQQFSNDEALKTLLYPERILHQAQIQSHPRPAL